MGELVNKIVFTTEQVRSMIGLRVVFHDNHWQIVEVLDDGPHLVLESLERHKSIQADQHGEAHRKVPKTYTIPILSPDRLEFSGEFLTLIPED